MGWGHQYIQTNNIRLHCVGEGEGELVILLHGFLEFWYSWRHQLPALGQRFKVVVPDLRGYNDSDKPDHGYDLDTISQDILGLIQALGYSRAHLVGHDWGGTLAWHFAQRFPDKLNRLALLSALPPQIFRTAIFSNWAQLQNWYLYALPLPGLPESLLQLNLNAFLSHWFQQQAVRKGAFSKSDTALYQAALQKPGAFRAMLQHARQLLTGWPWLPPKLAAIPVSKSAYQVPTLVLWGEEDSFLAHSTLSDLSGPAIAPYHLKTIPFSGHWLQQEAPESVNRELLDFLSQT